MESTLGHLSACDVDHVAVNFRGAPPDRPWRIHPNPRIGDRYGLIETAAVADTVAPDAIFVFNSFAGLPRYCELPALLRGNPRPLLVAQCPLLGEAVDPRLVARLAFFDCIVVLSDGVKRHFESCLTTCRHSRLIERMPRVEVIPHGFDSDLFQRIGDDSDRRRIKHEVLGIDPQADSFIVLNANRNEPRKRIDLTLRGFASFARDKPAGVRLHLHMGDVDGGLTALADELGIAARVTIGAGAGHPRLSDAALNRLYNACDVGLNTASGEGWGMIAFEHAATGAAQIVPGHGVCGETWAGCAEVLPAAPAETPSDRKSVV